MLKLQCAASTQNLRDLDGDSSLSTTVGTSRAESDKDKVSIPHFGSHAHGVWVWNVENQTQEKTAEDDIWLGAPNPLRLPSWSTGRERHAEQCVTERKLRSKCAEPCTQ